MWLLRSSRNICAAKQRCLPLRQQRRLLVRQQTCTSCDQTYDRGGKLLDTILAALDARRNPNNTLSQQPYQQLLQDLSRMDAFNSRGHQGRLDLLAMLEHTRPLQSHQAVLDIGCGVGGTARYVASTYGCHVTGIDASHEYVQVGRALNERMAAAGALANTNTPTTNNNSTIDIVLGSALELPLGAESFDVVWTEHVQMNIPDKGQLYREVARVLRPDGLFAFHDVLITSKEAATVTFPCPWADTAATSHLVTEASLREALLDAGLNVVQWKDVTQATIDVLATVVHKNEEKRSSSVHGSPALGVHLLMGNNAKKKVQNHWENLKNGSTAVVMGVAVKDDNQ
jgi:SAM-dependent methyltransferase